MSNEEIEMLAERDYRYIRTTADGVNPIAASNSRMWSYNLCERKVPRWKRAVDEAAQTKTWVIGVAHHIAASVDAIPLEDEANWITRESLEDCLHYALDAGFSCRTFAQVRAACGIHPPTSGQQSGCSRSNCHSRSGDCGQAGG
jgi:hypothetical protein